MTIKGLLKHSTLCSPVIVSMTDTNNAYLISMCGSILTKTCCSWVMTIWSCHMTMCNRKLSGRDELLLSVPVTGFFFALSSSHQGNIESYTYWDGKFQIIIGVGLNFYLYVFKGRTVSIGPKWTLYGWENIFNCA